MFSSVWLKFDRVSPWADLTNVVVIAIVPVETLIGVSPVVQLYISVTFLYTFGVVGVAPIWLPYTSVALPYTSVSIPYTSVSLPYNPVIDLPSTHLALPYSFRKPPLHFHTPP